MVGGRVSGSRTLSISTVRGRLLVFESLRTWLGLVESLVAVGMRLLAGLCFKVPLVLGLELLGGGFVLVLDSLARADSASLVGWTLLPCSRDDALAREV